MKIYSVISDEEIEMEYKRISHNVKQLRKAKKITQEDIALNMGFTTATFYTNAENYRQGKHFNLEHLIKIAYILECDLKDLV